MQTQWSVITNPAALRLANCSLAGAIPWTGASALPLPPSAVLDLSHNALTGDVPAELAGTPELYLSGNNLTGPIPPALAAAPALQRLVASRNFLQGPLPDFSGAAQLQELDLAGNLLNGWLPSLPPGVVRLALDGNPWLEGTLPDQV